jgi:predicted ATPase/DNA-binding winged helix-turn-helix (wHTH) protein
MIRVGNLEICKSRRAVYQDGLQLSLSARTTDLLLLLIEASGQLVSKKEIIKAVWPKTAVDESNLYVHISAIRKLLGPYRRLLVGVSGRGYQLNVEAPPEHRSAIGPDGDSMAAQYALPSSHALLFGRDDAIKDIHDLLRASRIVTLTGAGGIGKTRLATQSAKLVQSDYPDGVYFVELARFDDDDSVRLAIDGIVSSLEERDVRSGKDRSHAASVLLVLDNCEHLVKAVSQSVASLIDRYRQVAVLSTSRVPLGIAGEVIYCVQPLQVVSEGTPQSPTAMPGAIAMFMSHARAIDAQFGRDETSVELISELCQRLDGLPLAIEIAAARAAVLGINALLGAINERFNSLSGGFRTVLPRHQTLTATFDWSYRLLEENEKKVFRRLGVFQSHFSVSDACVIATDEDLSHEAVAAAVRGLSIKSLLVSHTTTQGEQEYRLHFTARAYALQKLDDNGERRSFELRLGSVAYRKLPVTQPGLTRGIVSAADAAHVSAEHGGDVGLRLGLPIT